MASSGTAHNAAARAHECEKPSTSSSDDGELSDVAFSDEDERPPPAPVPVAHATATMVQLPNKSVRSPLLPSPAHLADPSLEAIDPEILQQLPPEIQQEILLEHAAAQKRATDAAIRDALLDDNSGYGSRESSDALDDELQSSHGRSSQQDATGKSVAEWTCPVCTFANHPQLPSCEICDTARPEISWIQEDQGDYDWYNDRPVSPSKPNTKPSTLAQRIQSSAVASSLKKIKVPATPATTTLTQKDDPTAEDLLLAATNKIQQLHSSASQSWQQATNAIMAKASAARRPSLLASSPSSAGKPPSPQVCALLTMLQQDLNTKCEPGDELYETLLVRLWNAIYQDAPPPPPPRKNSIDSSTTDLVHRPPLPRRPFERVSEAWVDIGFQGPNPDTDFRGGGVLALKCLVYVFEAFPHKMLEIVRAQAPSETGRKWYPVCVAGINLTCMIAGLLRLGTGQFTSSQQLFWPLFEEPVAFYQLYFHAFMKMDAAWHRLNASFMEFGVVLKATRRMAVFMLDQAPQSLDELRVAAEKTLVDRFVVAVSQAFLSDTENGECPDPFHLLEDDNEVLITSPRSALATITFSTTAPTTPH